MFPELPDIPIESRTLKIMSCALAVAAHPGPVPNSAKTEPPTPPPFTLRIRDKRATTFPRRVAVVAPGPTPAPAPPDPPPSPGIEPPPEPLLRGLNAVVMFITDTALELSVPFAPSHWFCPHA